MLRRLARLASAPRAFARFRHDRRGVAAVEFAMILPALVLMYMGLVTMAQGFIVKRKVAILARTLSDLTAQATTISDTELKNIFDASAQILQPVADTTGLTGYIASVYIDQNKKQTICWSEPYPATGTAPTSITLDPGLLVPGTSIVVSSANYIYKPVWQLFGSSFPLTEDGFMRPRVVLQVTRQTGSQTKSCKTT